MRTLSGVGAVTCRTSSYEVAAGGPRHTIAINTFPEDGFERAAARVLVAHT
jgi:hypothetical protein